VSYEAEAWTLKKKEQAVLIFEEYMVLNMETGNGKVEGIENYKR